MGGRIPDTVVAEVRDRTDIVSVVQRFVSLKRSGRNYTGLCPFHADKDPSFTVSPERQIFHCFGCGKSGDVFRFIMEIQGRTFPEAVRDLADEAGVKIPETGYVLSKTDKDKRAKFLAINELAASFYQRELRAGTGHTGMTYLQSRGLDNETIEKFRLGFAPDGWQGLTDHLRQKGLPLPLAAELGLLARGARGYYDVFRNRLMFPIMSRKGEVIAFGGRALGTEQKGPKYLNSPGSSIYHKASVLYGLSQAAPAIARNGSAVIVEGYFDLLSLVSNGFEHIVAPCGTALTTQQLYTLARLTRKIYAVFDGDQAGFKAVERGAPLMLKAGLAPKAVFLPENMDPDDFVREKGADAFSRLLEEAPPIVDALINRVVEVSGPSISGRAAAAKRLSPVLSAITDPVERDMYIQRLAETIGTGKEAVLAGMLGNTRSQGGPPKNLQDEFPGSRQENLLIKLLAFHPELIQTALDIGAKNLVKGRDAALFLDAASRGERSAAGLLGALDNEATRHDIGADMVLGRDPAGPYPEKTLVECLDMMRKKNQKDKRRKILQALSKGGTEEDLKRFQEMVRSEREDGSTAISAVGTEKSASGEVENGE
ncbi:MAG: DNA primase [Deltaproteobacteria bacterium]|nr:DNA primase [Deltaproteobacteria bacterium]